MKIGIVSDSLAHLSFVEMLKVAKGLGISGVEFNTGNWSTAPHVDLPTLLGSESARDEFVSQIAEQNLEIISLTCNGV